MKSTSRAHTHLWGLGVILLLLCTALGWLTMRPTVETFPVGRKPKCTVPLVKVDETCEMPLGTYRYAPAPHTHFTLHFTSYEGGVFHTHVRLDTGDKQWVDVEVDKARPFRAQRTSPMVYEIELERPSPMPRKGLRPLDDIRPTDTPLVVLFDPAVDGLRVVGSSRILTRICGPGLVMDKHICRLQPGSTYRWGGAPGQGLFRMRILDDARGFYEAHAIHDEGERLERGDMELEREIAPDGALQWRARLLGAQPFADWPRAVDPRPNGTDSFVFSVVDDAVYTDVARLHIRSTTGADRFLLWDPHPLLPWNAAPAPQMTDLPAPPPSAESRVDWGALELPPSLLETPVQLNDIASNNLFWDTTIV